MVKKILTSKWLRFGLSAGLIYLAFRKVDILAVLGELGGVRWWLVILCLVWVIASSIIGAYRWSLFLVARPGVADIWNFFRTGYVSAFYALFLPGGMAIDLIRWVPLQKHYPQLSKARLFSSVMTDRVVGFTAYILVAMVAAIIGYRLDFKYPIVLLWLFIGLFVGVVVFYVIVFNFEVEKLILKIKFWKVHRLVEIAKILKDEDRSRLVKCFLVSLVAEFVWISQVWFFGRIFGAGMSLLSIFIFMPVIGLILMLPISVAGFGAREGLYLYFFGQLGLVPEKILAVSAFSGVIGILNALVGGILLLI